jgi:hypothetical protein
MNEITLVGVYASGRAAADAAAAIRRAGLGEVETVSPTADHAVLAALPRPASPVRLFTLLGAPRTAPGGSPSTASACW